MFKSGLFLSQMPRELGGQPLCHFRLNFLTQLFLLSFFGSLSDALIQPYRHFVGIIVVHRWRLSKCWSARLLFHDKPFRPKPIHMTFVVKILSNLEIALWNGIIVGRVLCGWLGVTILFPLLSVFRLQTHVKISLNISSAHNIESCRGNCYTNIVLQIHLGSTHFQFHLLHTQLPYLSLCLCWWRSLYNSCTVGSWLCVFFCVSSKTYCQICV